MKKQIVAIISAITILLFLFAGCGQTEALTWQDYYDLGVRYLSEGNYEEAIIAFTAAIEIDPKQADAYEGRGDAYVGLASTLTDEVEIATQYANAEADYLTAIELNGQSADLYSKLETVYIALGDTDAAVAILEQGYAATGDETLKDAADTLSAENTAETNNAQAGELQADAEAETAAAEEPEAEEAEEDAEPTWWDYYSLGSGYLDAGDYEAAIETFTEAISLGPDRADAYVGRGDAYVAMAEALDPETQAEEIAELYAMAEADYLAALELDEMLTDVYLKLADLYVAMGDSYTAVTFLTSAYPVYAYPVYGDYGISEKLSSILNASNDLVQFEEIHFMGSSIEGLTVAEAMTIMEENGLYVKQVDPDEAFRIRGYAGEKIHYPTIYVSQDYDEDCFGMLSYKTSIWYGEAAKWSIGVRDITLGDTLEEVLQKLGYSGAAYVNAFITETFCQEYGENEYEAMREQLRFILGCLDNGRNTSISFLGGEMCSLYWFDFCIRYEDYNDYSFHFEFYSDDDGVWRLEEYSIIHYS